MNNATVMNKTMALEDLNTVEAGKIIEELNGLILSLRKQRLKISSWYGRFDLLGDPYSSEWINRGYNYTPLDRAVDDKNFPWFLYWEIVWVVQHGGFTKEDKVLDLGGSSSLFSYYLASKGIEVTTVDLQKELVDNADYVAHQMDWKLKNFVKDMRELDFACQFSHITSICVYEHIPLYDRVVINQKLKNLLFKGGRFSITFDYRNPSGLARIGSPEDVHEQFVKPSGLEIRGNQNFTDTGDNYLLHPFYSPSIPWKYKLWCVARGQFSPLEMMKTKKHNDYTFGALFLEKRSDY